MVTSADKLFLQYKHRLQLVYDIINCFNIYILTSNLTTSVLIALLYSSQELPQLID